MRRLNPTNTLNKAEIQWLIDHLESHISHYKGSLKTIREWNEGKRQSRLLEIGVMEIILKKLREMKEREQCHSEE